MVFLNYRETVMARNNWNDSERSELRIMHFEVNKCIKLTNLQKKRSAKKADLKLERYKKIKT
jgi:hypothetical protein